MIFPSKHIRTEHHHLLGSIWDFRNFRVTMIPEGFECNCKKNSKIKCYHIKSVELGLLGVDSKEYAL